MIALGLGVLFFVVPDLIVKAEAEAARAQFRRAVGAYLDLVALERAADGGPADALDRAARVAQGGAFTRIGDALARARLAGLPPWLALADLAEDIGITELRDLADIVAVAGDDGAAVYDTLVAKAAALRARVLSDAEAEANAASERRTLPAVLLGFGFLLLVCYPALARVLS
jgi:Flp pilus assembly protein TadB